MGNDGFDRDDPQRSKGLSPSIDRRRPAPSHKIYTEQERKDREQSVRAELENSASFTWMLTARGVVEERTKTLALDIAAKDIADYHAKSKAIEPKELGRLLELAVAKSLEQERLQKEVAHDYFARDIDRAAPTKAQWHGKYQELDNLASPPSRQDIRCGQGDNQNNLDPAALQAPGRKGPDLTAQRPSQPSAQRAQLESQARPDPQSGRSELERAAQAFHKHRFRQSAETLIKPGLSHEADQDLGPSRPSHER
jgi:hypothetical protein